MAGRTDRAPAWAVFLDRDGVLTEAPVVDGVARSPETAAEMRRLPGGREALELLSAAGAMLIVVTNQPELSRGRLSMTDLGLMNDRLRRDLPLDDIVVCPHTGADGCACRKPAPGMLLDAAARHGLDLGASWMVGDRWVDIAAGAAAGVRTVLVERDYSWQATSAGVPDRDLRPGWTVRNVREAAAVIIGAPIAVSRAASTLAEPPIAGLEER